MPKICIVPRVEGTGGMTSFRIKFEKGLSARGIEVTHDLNEDADAALVIAGTRSLPALLRAQKRGIRIVQRLDGINWVHRARWAGLRYTVRAEYGNFMLGLIRSRIADRVIYQSEFIRSWWHQWRGPVQKPEAVILNGVDLSFYTPLGPETPPTDKTRILLLEGSMARGLNTGLYHALDLARETSKQRIVEVVIAGTVDAQTQQNALASYSTQNLILKFLATIPREQIPQIARSSHLMYCAEINPPCPNSVIESLACGLPVIGFDTGSLKELVKNDAGRITPYGANPWKLEQPNIRPLANAADEILNDQPRFRKQARAHAEAELGLDQMMESYLGALFA